MSKLTTVMQRLGLSDQRLANLSGVGRVTITRGRLEQRNFCLEDALAIAEALRGHLDAWDLPLKAKSRRALERMRIRGATPATESPT